MAGDNLINQLSQEEAEKLLLEKKSDLKVRDNHEILEKAIEESGISLLTCNNPGIKLQKMCSGVVFVAPDYLQNPKNQKHIQQKKEIELYINSFDNICKNINDYIDKASKSLINLQKPSYELDNEIKKILSEYNETVKNLCAPLLNERIGLNNENLILNGADKVEFDKEKTLILDVIDQFMEEAKDLTTNYLNQFKPIESDVNYICKSIDIIPDPINILKEKVENYKSRLEETLEEINDENDDIHYELLKIKRLFKIIKSDKNKIIKEVEKSIGELDIKYKSRKDDVNPLKKKIDQNIKILRNKSGKIKNDIVNLREKYRQSQVELADININPITTSDIKEKIYKFVNPIKTETNIVYKEIDTKKEDNIIKQTSLDLLYLMDITGSMEAYVDNTKKELINVMKKIIDSFNGIDINLGFIGYKDLEEHSKDDYIDIGFTKNHEEIRKKIEEVEIGGGKDIAEDIAWGFERALNKDWESNAKFAILAGDAPCHGLKYHGHKDYDDFPEGIPGRKDIEESIKELCNKNVCLFCIKLTERTDMMYKIFQDIYINNNKKSLFYTEDIGNASNLNSIILEKCKEVYEKNRDIK